MPWLWCWVPSGHSDIRVALPYKRVGLHEYSRRVEGGSWLAVVVLVREQAGMSQAGGVEHSQYCRYEVLPNGLRAV